MTRRIVLVGRPAVPDEQSREQDAREPSSGRTALGGASPSLEARPSRPRLVPRVVSSPPRHVPPLGEILIERKALTPEQLREAIERQQQSRKRLGQILVELGFASPEAVLDGLSAQSGVPPARVDASTVTPDVMTCLSGTVARKYAAVPLLKIGSSLVVAIANPRDLQAIDALRAAAGCEIQTMVALEAEIQAAIDQYYGGRQESSGESEHAGPVVVDLPDPDVDRHALQLSLADLMTGETMERFHDLIRRPQGLVLVTGPPGSGRTWTLYAALAELTQIGKTVTTIEDTVEDRLPGVHQRQTNAAAGFTFARGLRAILRQDPDVIMVGEIPDPETLEMAIEAALTGRTVLSTLHADDSVAALTRLLERGVEPYVLASAVSGVLAQRLVRRICTNCRRAISTPDRVAHMFGGDPPQTVFRGLGCAHCRRTGYRGRVGVYELLTVGHDVRRLLCARATEHDLRTAAREDGLTTLWEQALDLVRDGSTTIDEVVRVCHRS